MTDASRATDDPSAGRPGAAPDLPEKTYWQLVPRRELRRALLLVVALVAIVGIQRCSRSDVAAPVLRGPGATGAVGSRPPPRVRMNPLPAAGEPPARPEGRPR